jgi:hypothetical protein
MMAQAQKRAPKTERRMPGKSRTVLDLVPLRRDPASTPVWEPAPTSRAPEPHQRDFKCESGFAFSTFERLANLIADRWSQTAQALYDVGAALIEAKSVLEHGEYLKFLADSRVCLEPRVAQKMTKISSQQDGRELASLGVAKATILLASLAPEARKALMGERDIVQMTVVELRKLMSGPREKDKDTRYAIYEEGFIAGCAYAQTDVQMPDAKVAAKRAWEEARSK